MSSRERNKQNYKTLGGNHAILLKFPHLKCMKFILDSSKKSMLSDPYDEPNKNMSCKEAKIHITTRFPMNEVYKF